MELDSRQLRFCRSISCKSLKGLECIAKECEHPDRVKAIEELMAGLKAVKHG